MSAMTFDSSPFPEACVQTSYLLFPLLFPFSAWSKGNRRRLHADYIPGRMLLMGEIAFGRWGSMYFFDVCPVHHIWINYFEICINYFVICMIYELSSARVQNGVCWNAEPLSHYPTWQVEPMLESNQLIWVELNCSKRRTIHAPISKLIGSTN